MGSPLQGGRALATGGRAEARSPARWRSAGALLLATGLAAAQSGGDYRIASSTLDGGGGVVAGGDFRATTTIAQIDAHAALAGGAFVVRGGFWPTPDDDRLFRNGFEPVP